MKTKKPTLALSGSEDLRACWDRVVRRRSFLQNLGVVGAAVPAGALLTAQSQAQSTILVPGDIAILRFLAAAEIIETDLWQQYNELGGEDSGGNNAYKEALENIDDDIPRYIEDNTQDEMSHGAFLNAYLIAKGAPPVSLEAFRTLPSSQATGAQQKGRLTNLMNLNVDTSWYTRYRSSTNPDLGATFPQAVNINNEPGIPLNDTDTPPDMEQPIPPVTDQQKRMQAIANTAAFHFAFIEQGGSSLYASMALKVTGLEALRIVISIGGVEVNHFAIWHDALGGAVSGDLAGVTDPETGVTFPNLNEPPFGGDLFETELVMPEPCDFILKAFPKCSVIRPTLPQNAGAMAAVQALTADGLFQGQSQGFFDTLNQLARAADAATRGL